METRNDKQLDFRLIGYLVTYLVTYLVQNE